MTTILIDPRDGMLSVADGYADKDRCASAGCHWDAESKMWKMVFTLSTLETLLDKIPHAVIDPSVKDGLARQHAREEALEGIRKSSDSGQDLAMRVPGLKAVLFPYQKLGVLYAITGGSVLIGDHMGLGKSIQGLSAALVQKSKGLIKDCLIVTPASLKYNWPLEIAKFTDEKCIVVDGAKPEARIAKWLDTGAFFKIANYELVVEDLFGGREYKAKEDETPEQKAKRVARMQRQRAKSSILRKVRDHRWGMLICDEAHMIKHATSKRYKAIKSIKADYRIFLTGTPMDGRLEELYNIMGVLAPGLLGSKSHFFNRYIVTDYFGAVKGYKNISEVQRIIKPFFIRRLKKDVLKQLPDKTYENKVINLTPEERRIYDAIKAGRHPCVIKDDQPAEPMVRAIRCMQFINFPQMIDPSCKATTKLDVFRDIMDESVTLNAQKAIVFTQFKQLLNVADGILKELGLNFLRIDGDTPKQVRADYQSVFNEDSKVDCIIGTDAMSTGLNLTGGDLVINLTQCWQPAVMAQREGRSHRIGREGNVLVVNMLCRNTVEEKMRNVLYAKDRLTSETLGDNTDEAVLMRLSPEEIEALL